MLGRDTFKTLLAASALALMAGGASAATVSCPGTAITTDREFGADPADSCEAFGSGNFDNSALGIAMKPMLLDKTDSNEGTGVEISFTQSATTSPLGWSGTFSILVPTGQKIVGMYLALKSGVAMLDPDWALFKLADNTQSGTWFIDNSAVADRNGDPNQALSHMNVYGTLVPVPVPVPAAGLLMLGALGGLAALRRRRRAV